MPSNYLAKDECFNSNAETALINVNSYIGTFICGNKMHCRKCRLFYFLTIDGLFYSMHCNSMKVNIYKIFY